MSRLKFTPAEIKAYWEITPKIPHYVKDRFNVPQEDLMRPKQYDALHPFYVKTLDCCEGMRVHADGIYPFKLIDERRPNEPDEVKAYREKIWIAKTKPIFTKIFSSLAKIRRSADWMIDFPKNDAEFSLINSEDTLQEYCMKNLPYFTSITDWAFTALLRKYLIDPNGVVFISPLSTDIPKTELLQPYPVIYDCMNVLDYVDEDYTVLLNPFGATYYDERGMQFKGSSMYIITTMYIERYDQVNAQRDFDVFRYDHNLNWLPAFKLGGTLIEQSENYFYYESKIAGIIPELDEALRENSDLQAVKVLHQYPTMWEFTNKDCIQCNGVGRLRNPRWTQGCDDSIPAHILCEACHGQGKVASGPFGKIEVKPNDATTAGQQLPLPPAGFVTKDNDIIEIQEKSIERHIACALSAINFEFLDDTPLAQSGTAKQYDRNESNNTTHAVAEDLVAMMDKTIKAIAYYRYSVLYPIDKINEMLPDIPVPENFDLYSVADAQKQLNDAKTGKTNPIIINAMEQDFSNKVFSADDEVRERLSLILTLDPLPNITEDEKMSRLSNKGITQIAYVISSNIQEFVQRALEEDAKFADKKLKDQKAKMEEYAKEVVDENSATAKIVKMDTSLNPDGTPKPNPLNIVDGGTI